MSNPRSSPDSSTRQQDVKAWLREALPAANQPPRVLGNVQRRIREGSRGKFYRDRWSTAKHPPIATYLVTSVLMLFVLGALYLVLGPLASPISETRITPAPVRVVPPTR